MSTETPRLKAIISMRLAQYLIRAGYDLRRVAPSYNHENFVVFLFTESEEIEQSINDYITERDRDNERR